MEASSLGILTMSTFVSSMLFYMLNNDVLLAIVVYCLEGKIKNNLSIHYFFVFLMIFSRAVSKDSVVTWS